MNLVGPLNSGDAAGSAGSATNNTDTTAVVSGRVLALYVRYNDSPPAGTTDVTVATAGTQHPAVTILTLTDAATDGWFYPRAVAQDTAGADVTFDGTNELYTEIPICDYVNVKIDEANAGDSVDVWMLLGDD